MDCGGLEPCWDKRRLRFGQGPMDPYYIQGWSNWWCEGGEVPRLDNANIAQIIFLLLVHRGEKDISTGLPRMAQNEQRACLVRN